MVNRDQWHVAQTAAMHDALVSHAEFCSALDTLLAALGVQGEGRLALAVSGGSDSMALLRLARDAYPGRIVALTVDHGLRAASAREAEQVTDWCRALGIEHRVLRWEGEKPTTGLQRRAREARYTLLAQAASELGADGLALPLITAHTLDDQAETFLLRLAHGSDIGGLGAMRASSEIAFVPPVPLLRPLLGMSRARLRATLSGLDQSWIDDPSNEDARFERVRLRQIMPALESSGVSRASLAQAARLMARIDRVLLGSARAVCPGQINPEGSVAFEAKNFECLPEVAAVRFLSHFIRLVGGEPYPPARASLTALGRELQNPAARGSTLGGCQFRRLKGSWVIEREPRAAARATAISLAGPGTALWDNRFWVRAPGGLGPATIQAQGNLPAISCEGGRVEAPAIAPGPEAFRQMRDRPAALFVGEARMEAKTAYLWTRVMKDTSPRDCESATVS